MKFIINLFSLGRSYHHWSTIGDPLWPDYRLPPNFHWRPQALHRRPQICVGDPKLFIGDPKLFIGDPKFLSETPSFSLLGASATKCLGSLQQNSWSLR